jgi:hypothetical protein
VGLVATAQATGGVLQSGVHARSYGPEGGVRFGAEGQPPMIQNIKGASRTQPSVNECDAVARASERPPRRPGGARARDAVSARRARTARLGRREAAMLCGRDSKGQPRGRSTAQQALQGANGVSDRSAQRAARVLAAGALEAFSVGPRSVIYKRAAGALEAFSVGPRSVIYKRAAGALEAFSVGPRSVIYKRAAGALAAFAADPLLTVYIQAVTGAISN